MSTRGDHAVAPKDPLLLARESSKKALTLAAELAQNCNKDEKCARRLKKALESLQTRARSGPQLLATWGPAAFLLFIASKAVNTSHMLQQRAAGILGCSEEAGNSQDVRAEKGSTAVGYLMYAMALLYYHLETGAISCSSYIRDMLDSSIRLYLELGRWSSGYTRLLAFVEALARFIQLYLDPLLDKYERINYANAKSFLDEVSQLAST